MKKLLLLIFIPVLGFWNCKDDTASFDVTIPAENISFRAIPGGAVMRYKLPNDKDVSSINVRYNDVFGEEIRCSGSFAGDSIVLYGFNEAQQDVRALVTLSNRRNVESEPVEVFFDTKDSGPIAFFDNVEVLPGWYGFIVSYSMPEGVRGMAHVFYLGENPLTHEPDTILVTSFALRAGTAAFIIRQQQEKSVNDIVIRTEDFRGYTVMQKVWTGIKSLESVNLEYPAFDFEDPENLSIEDPDWSIGSQYLFDGNTKGFFLWPREELKMYTSGPDCTNRPLFILDLHKPLTIAGIRLYAMLYIKRDLPIISYDYDGPPFPYYDVYVNFRLFDNRLPCHLTVYASNDKVNWLEVGYFEQGERTAKAYRWCSRTYGIDSKYYIGTQAAYDAAEPCYLEIPIPPREPFRYLKVVFHKLFIAEDGYSYNTLNCTILQELEVYIAKE